MTSLPSILADVIGPGLALLPPAMDSRAARVMLVAIGLQESGFSTTRQYGGPAHSYWQFERGGGVKGVLNHPASKRHAEAACAACKVNPVAVDLYAAMAEPKYQPLSAAMARLLLYTDAHALPVPLAVNQNDSWDYYLRNWRPGKPHPQAWAGHWMAALAAVPV